MDSSISSCAAVFVPADPPRSSTMAFYTLHGVDDLPDADREDLEVVTPFGSRIRRRMVSAVVMNIGEALPVLLGRNGPTASPSIVFWRAVLAEALVSISRGRLLPGLTDDDHDAWRIGPLDADDVERLRLLTEAMPASANAVAEPAASPLRLPDPADRLRSFMDAVADTLPRTPAASALVGFAPFASPQPQHIPRQRDWATQIATGRDSGVGVSLRLEEPHDLDAGFRAVVQLHDLADPAAVADADQLWSATPPPGFGPRARMELLLTLRRCAHAWVPIERLLSGPAPIPLELDDDELLELFDGGAERLMAAGVRVHWPKDLVRSLTAKAVVEPEKPGSDLPTSLSTENLLSFRWKLAVGDSRLTDAEVEQLADTHRSVVRLRDGWVVVDPATLRQAQQRGHQLDVMDGLNAALTGVTSVDGNPVEVETGGWLAELRAQLSDPEHPARQTIGQPAGLRATLRDYQLRGLNWLHRMTALGLGCCLADDMGLGKTITVIALHLQRQSDGRTAGPTLVVCPTSLLGNWQREIERFAPDVPVRRFHGADRALTGVEKHEFVLTTYGTLRREAEALAAVDWGMAVADEAQHVKNPFSVTVKALRSVPAHARVALTGTPVENKLSDLWSLLDWGTPGLLGTLKQFRTGYAKAVERDNDPDAARRLSQLIQPFLLRRKKTDPGIAPELPAKTETDRVVPLTGEQVGLYEAVVAESMAAIAATDGINRRGLVLKLLTDLKQVCNHPAQYLKQDATRLAGRSGKLDLLEELVDTIVAEDDAALVFTQYVGMARLIETRLSERGIITQLLHGGTPVKRREDMVQSFQDGQVPVFLLSLKAAGVGLNLTGAGHVIHFDRWWNPAVEEQATDRAYRIGQTRTVQVHRIITEGTVEDRIAELLARKRKLADAVLSGGEGALTELTDTQLTELVSLRKAGR